jgi:hypothetical protein
MILALMCRLQFHDLVVSLTSIERWNFAIVAFPEVIALVLCVFRRSPVVFVWIVDVHVEVSQLYVVSSDVSSRLIGR